MQIACENCLTIYEAPDEKIKANELIECPVCQYVNINKKKVEVTPDDTKKSAAVVDAGVERDYGKTMYGEVDETGKVKQAEVQVTEGRLKAIPEDKELYVVISDSSGTEIKHQIKTSECILGRGEGSDIVINDPETSRKHCAIDIYENKFVIRDLESTNGTYLNDTRIKEDLLKEGDRIRIGNTLLTFVVKPI
ncbi:MAG: FHA domain-containing protein [Nitrospirota bacterium]